MAAAERPIKRTAFAALARVNRSTVTRWADAGRLVMDERGNVYPEASLARLAETSGGRDDVAARHAANRGAEIPAAQPGADSAPAARNPGATGGNKGATVEGESRADAQARKDSAAADLLEMELAQKRGQLIPREDVDQALKTFAATTRARLDVLADQLAPLLAPVSDLAEIHALLAEHLRLTLVGIADDLHRAEAALGGASQ